VQNKIKNGKLEQDYREIEMSKNFMIKVAMANKESSNPLKTLERKEKRSVIENSMKRLHEIEDMN